MKAKMISAGVVLALMLVLCWYARWAVQSDAETLRSLAVKASAVAENGDFQEAVALLGELEATIDERRGRLEVLSLHEDLNAASSAAAEARVWLRYERQEEFQVAIARMLDALTLLDERQMLTWSNLL